MANETGFVKLPALLPSGSPGGVLPLRKFLLLILTLPPGVVPVAAMAQGTGTVTGTVTRSGEGSALASVSVTVQSTGQSAVTGTDGQYTLRRVPEGPQTIVFRWLGYRPTETQTTVEAGGTVTVNAALEPVAI